MELAMPNQPFIPSCVLISTMPAEMSAAWVNQVQQLSKTSIYPQTKDVRLDIGQFPTTDPGMADK